MAESGQRFYEEEEAEQILRVAASLSAPHVSMSRDKLLATASELGIPVEAVEQAERQLASQRTQGADLKQFELYKKRAFFWHLVSFVLVNVFLVAINLAVSPHYLWFLWVVAGWGLGLAFHFATLVLQTPDGDQQAFQKWRHRRDRLAGVQPTLIDQTDVIIDRYVAKRLRSGEDATFQGSMRYLRASSELDKFEAEDAVEKYIRRNPGAISLNH